MAEFWRPKLLPFLPGWALLPPGHPILARPRRDDGQGPESRSPPPPPPAPPLRQQSPPDTATPQGLLICLRQAKAREEAAAKAKAEVEAMAQTLPGSAVPVSGSAVPAMPAVPLSLAQAQTPLPLPGVAKAQTQPSSAKAQTLPLPGVALAKAQTPLPLPGVAKAQTQLSPAKAQTPLPLPGAAKAQTQLSLAKVQTPVPLPGVARAQAPLSLDKEEEEDKEGKEDTEYMGDEEEEDKEQDEEEEDHLPLPREAAKAHRPSPLPGETDKAKTLPVPGSAVPAMPAVPGSAAWWQAKRSSRWDVAAVPGVPAVPAEPVPAVPAPEPDYSCWDCDIPPHPAEFSSAFLAQCSGEQEPPDGFTRQECQKTAAECTEFWANRRYLGPQQEEYRRIDHWHTLGVSDSTSRSRSRSRARVKKAIAAAVSWSAAQGHPTAPAVLSPGWWSTAPGRRSSRSRSRSGAEKNAIAATVGCKSTKGCSASSASNRGVWA